MKELLSKHKYILLAAVLITATVLRLYQLGQVPASPNWDEVSYGYNAYSILETGKDEYGKMLPIVLESYNDFKPALYVYLTLPSVAFFGLNTFAVRLPAAIFGIAAVAVAYIFARHLFKKNDIALVTAFFLAVSPMHIQFSRTAFESNIGAMVNVLIALFFLKGLRKNIFLPTAAFLASLNIYLYQAEKIFTPLLILLLAAVYWRDLMKVSKKYLLASVFVGLLSIAPMVYFMTTNPQSLIRAQGTSVFSQKAQVLEKSTHRLALDKSGENYLGTLFNNRRVEYGKEMLSGYLSHFDVNWMFISGDVSSQRQPPFMGNMYLWSLPFLLLGIYRLAVKKYDTRLKFLLFGWILFTPIPSAFTYDVPNTIRVLNFLPILQIFLALGIIQAITIIGSRIQWRVVRVAVYCLLFFAFCFNFIYYLNQYYIQYNQIAAASWQYGYEQVVDYAQEHKDEFEKVVVFNEEPMEQSYMFFLFYTKFSPEKYHEYKEFNTSGQFDATHKFGDYEFIPIRPGDAARNPDTLYIATPENFGEQDRIIHTITTPGGDEVMYIASGTDSDE